MHLAKGSVLLLGHGSVAVDLDASSRFDESTHGWLEKESFSSGTDGEH